MNWATKDKALIEGASNGHTEVVRTLLDAGATVYGNNRSALRAAAAAGHAVVVELLLKAGADIHAEDGKALRRASYAYGLE